MPTPKRKKKPAKPAPKKKPVAPVKKPARKKPAVALPPTVRPRPVVTACQDCKGAGIKGFDAPELCPTCKGAGTVLSTRPADAILPRDNGKHPGGRTPLYTPERLALIAGAISKGLTNQQAADLAEVGLTTLEGWLSDEEFSGPIKKAKAERLLLRLATVESRGENWTAVAWILERAHGVQFAPPKTTQRVEHDLQPGMSDASLKLAQELLGLM